ncbi:hypothetical protein BGZ50_004147 [Haplosporangium sp. Z 11]|nr:hypothetical protein BGZ50_004147 [Haplosporangium sp. Z 11]
MQASSSSRATQLRAFGLHSNGTECFANLQSLEYDPEPLLNGATIDSILKAGKTVVLTREYVGSSKSNERRRSAKIRSFLKQERGDADDSNADDDDDDDDSSYLDTDPADEHTSVGEIGVGGDVDIGTDAGISARTTRIRTSSAGSLNLEKMGQRQEQNQEQDQEQEHEHEQDAGSDIDSCSSRYDSEGSYFPPVESTFSESYKNSANFVAAHSKAGYADFVQGLNPTWSQSPAPSPNIIKEDPTINPFFYQPLAEYPAMDDDTFDPPDPTPESTEDGHSSASEHLKNPQACSRPTMRPQGSTPASQLPPSSSASILANARSLIHVPLYRSTDHNNQRYLPSDIRNHRPPAMPVGIVSFLSDQIPYPPEALDILTDLNPFLANQITNALRLEDMVLRSKRWGDLSTTGLSEGPRTNETFAESIQRKLNDNNDIRTPKPSTSNVDGQSRSMQYSSRRTSDPTKEKALAEAALPSQAQKRRGQRKDMRDSNLPIHLNRQDTSTRERDITNTNRLETDLSETSTLDETCPNPSVVQSSNPERSEKPTEPSSIKEPEATFNLDSTTDEIHRSLNLLNLDVTGSATCPLAPQTKKMLGKPHHSSKSTQSHQLESAFLSSWTNNRRRTETSPDGPDADEVESPDSEGMWQTLQPEDEELNIKPMPAPSSRCAAGNEIDITMPDSPYFGSTHSMHSVSPSNGPKRHHFSTSKRSGVRRRRKSIKDNAGRHHASQRHPSESPVSGSPYTPTFPSHPSDGTLGIPGFNGTIVFSPEPSPGASPTARHPRMFNQEFINEESGCDIDYGIHHKNHPRGLRREDGERGRAPLSRHGSGWSFNSDDTSLASPSLQHEKAHGRRKHKKKHHAYGSDRPELNPFPRTRLLRLIVDAISHHVFTLSPQTGCLTWLNQRALQYAGFPLSQLLHTSWTRVLHEDDRATIQPLFKECFDKGEMFNAQYRIRRFDGQYRWFLGRLAPVRDCGGSVVHWFGTSTDIHDQKLAELQLNRQVELELNEKKYRLLAEAIPQIVFTAAPHIGLTYANAKWFTYSGQVFEQAFGLGFMDHVHPDDRAKCFLPSHFSDGNSSTGGSPPATTEPQSGFRQSTSPGIAFGQGPGEVSYQTELRLLRKDGKYRWFLVKCISVEVVEQGRKWFGTCTDINDQKLLEHKLKEAHDAAQKSTESKTRFLSNMSHEIRTPLVGITGMINFLITTDLTSEQLDYVHTVQQSADALLHVINDILDLSKVEAGMMKLEMEPFSVHAMIEGANELLSTLAIQKSLELGFLVEDEVPEVVIGDRVRLRQVLINIIGNAIKFTTHGEVFSRCSLVAAKPNSEPDLLTIKFEISDTGKGFDEAERAVMFKPFSQVDTSSTRKHGGTGLGLVLSKEFVELHGGKIACESVKGQGSKFWFTFVARVPPPNVTARATTPIASDEIRMNGLLNSHVNNAAEAAPSTRAKVGTRSASPPPPTTPANSEAVRDPKRQSEPALLRHVTGLKLIPGEMCYAEPDFEDTKKTATKAFKKATKKIERGDFLTVDTTLETEMSGEDEGEGGEPSKSTPAAASTNNNGESSVNITKESPPGELCTAMTRTESILDDRRYIKVGQLTPSNPPMGEPPCVAIIAANLPNPATDMKLAIPARVLESKKNVTAAAAAAAGAAAVVAAAVRPDILGSADSRSTSSMTQPESSTESKSVSLDTVGVARAVKTPDQARILVISDLLHARETIVHLIKQLIPKELNPIMDVATDLKEGIDFLVGVRRQAVTSDGKTKYNYVVINLGEYMCVMDIFSVLHKEGVLVEPDVTTCVITTPIQRAALMEAVKAEEASMEFVKAAGDFSTVKVLIPTKVEWVFKPLTKAKLYVAFADIVAHQERLSSGADGSGEGEEEAVEGVGKDGRGTSGGIGQGSNSGKSGVNAIHAKRKTAHQVAVNQKEIFNEMHEAMEGKNIHILLAEDDLTNQKVIRRYFQKVGAELTIANDGNECLDEFISHPREYFSLILCDLFMPGRDGYEATKAIRRWEDEHLGQDDKRIPIVALSANVMANVAEKCLNSGFTSYLSKPVDFKKLSDTLKKLVL